ncbi:MAG: DUF433 domain-containing protein [Okeania sp. SIO3C4]|nr:DUF433 domain-containing protein [Okeania sp. SIO3C4]
MTISITAEPIPLTINTDGVALVAGTRVTLDTVVYVFQQGATAEEICLAYPSLNLADVYAVIVYYLRHQEEVEKYLQGRQKIAQEVRRKNEAKFDPQRVRDRLIN